ncbi:hypothetical protein [Porticoccus sp.]
MTIHMRRKLAASKKDKPLTQAHMDVLIRTANGQRAAEIAWDRGTDPRTVEELLRQARGRLGAKTTTHAVAMLVATMAASSNEKHAAIAGVLISRALMRVLAGEKK